MLQYVLLVLGLLLLIKGADFLVNGASSIARGLHISDIFIGLTIVAFGTSLPELVISLVAGARGAPNLVIGNVIGSNICNILLILGVASVIQPLQAKSNTVYREIPFTLLASLMLLALVNDGMLDARSESALDRTDGIALLGLFSVFIIYIALAIRADANRDWAERSASEHRIWPAVALVVAGLAGLTIGGQLSVRAAVEIARSWEVSETLIGLTILAIGTSLPELATSSVAAFRKSPDIAVGNIVGSNIFNIFFVLGIPAVLYRIPFDTNANLDMLVMNLATLMLFAFMFVGRPAMMIQRSQGVMFLVLYGLYMTFVVQRG